MTQPKVQAGGSASASTDLTENQAAADAKATSEQPKEENQSSMQLQFGMCAGLGYAGDRDGYVFPSKETDFDYINYCLQGGPKWDLAKWGSSDQWKFRLGGVAEVLRIEGNDNTPPGTSLTGLMARAHAELDWRDVWGDGFIAGPSRFYLQPGIGYMWGKDNFGTGSIHDQSALGVSLRAALNLVDLEAGGLGWGLDFFADPMVADGENNSPRVILGGMLNIHPARQIKTPPPPPRCDDEIFDINRHQNEINELRAANEKLEDQVGAVRLYLENRKENPFNQANVVKALRLGQVVELLHDGSNRDALHAAVIEASKESPDKWAGIFAKVDGVEEDRAQAAVKVGLDKYPDGYEFWKLPEVDSDKELEGLMDIGDTECKENADEDRLREIERKLEEAVKKLRERKGAVEQQYRRAIHLAGLTIGVEDTHEILAATILNVDTPSFKLAFPKDPQVSEIEAIASRVKASGTPLSRDNADVKKVARRIFSSPDFELEKFEGLAKWMNGEGKLPGEERTEIALAEIGETEGKRPEAAEKAFKDFVKNLRLGIFGHTDSQGTDANNQALSDRRARAAKALLVIFGVDEARLVTKGFGEEYPVLPESPGLGWGELQIAKGKNRRVEFVPIGGGTPPPGAASRDKTQGHDPDAAEKAKKEGITGPEGGNKPAPKAKPKPKPKPKIQ